jgi:D-apionolactonase
MSASRAIKLYGTEEPIGETTALSAGALEGTLDTGNLRYIKIGGKEAIRAISYLVRNRNWGTYNPEISNLTIDQGASGFRVTYDALCKDDQQSFRYSARIEGTADGSLTFSAEGDPLTDFVTNRTGFVVLHPLDGVVGEPVTVEHVDGRIVKSKFPELVDPDCPFLNVRALTHEVLPGVSVTCRMEGEAFEMEDHRNWMDASYKTYVRPLALPWPYTLKKGEKLVQKVTLKLVGKAPAATKRAGAKPIEISIDPSKRHAAPRIGLAVPAEGIADAIASAALIRRAQPSFLVCHFDPRAGHDQTTMRSFAELGAATGVELVLEAIVPCLDPNGKPSADVAIMQRDVAAIGAAASAAGVKFARAAVSPAVDLGSTLPGSVFPNAPPWADLIAAARKAFPGVPIGGGMFSYFTELNRKRPPAGVLDFVVHTGLPAVHAGDDESMTETLEATPSIFRSVQAFAPGTPYWIFPTAIGMRQNPYGAAPAENPKGVRQAMSRVDPRERGLIGTAWYAGYVARAAAAGVDAVTLAATHGPSSIVFQKQPHTQPWFDQAGAEVYPHYHVIAGHAALTGDTLAATSSDARSIQAFAVGGRGGTTVWLSNLTAREHDVRILGVTGNGSALMLDEDTFEAACHDAAWLRASARTPLKEGWLTLKPYAVAEIRFG